MFNGKCKNLILLLCLTLGMLGSRFNRGGILSVIAELPCCTVFRLSNAFKNFLLKQSTRKQLSLLLNLHKESCVLLTQFRSFRWESSCKTLYFFSLVLMMDHMFNLASAACVFFNNWVTTTYDCCLTCLFLFF